MRDHRNYRAFQIADELTMLIYKETLHFPKEETYGLRQQIRRSSVSIVSNIVEGFGRNTKKDLLHFLDMAFGSARELEYQLSLAIRLGYFPQVSAGLIASTCDEEIRVLRGLITSIRQGAPSVDGDFDS